MSNVAYSICAVSGSELQFEDLVLVATSSRWRNTVSWFSDFLAVNTDPENTSLTSVDYIKLADEAEFYSPMMWIGRLLSVLILFGIISVALSL